MHISRRRKLAFRYQVLVADKTLKASQIRLFREGFCLRCDVNAAVNAVAAEVSFSGMSGRGFFLVGCPELAIWSSPKKVDT